MGKLNKMAADEFARRLKGLEQEQDKHFCFFIGAGCSVSSGIPAASKLVKDHWLPRLRNYRAPDTKNLEAWATETFGYDPTAPSASYGKVIEALFLYPEDRQREIEKLCEGKFPGFGYAVLASLIAQESGRFNVVLTTNFDDMVPDALYLYTKARPLVVQHESLASYIRPTRTRPLVVRVHGDHRLSPYNTEEETKEMPLQLQQAIASLLHDRGLIFLGYAGADEGICRMLDMLPSTALPFGVFWVSRSEPDGILRPWLEKRGAHWIEKDDFDEMMLLIQDTFELPEPDRKRFEDVFDHYFKTYQVLSKRIQTLQESTPEVAALKTAVQRTDKTFKDWWAVVVKAERIEETDSDAADAIYAAGILEFPDSGPLLGRYAIFLENIRKDYARAEEYYRKALEADPNHSNNLGNYALFLENIRKDYARAEEYYRKALEADPNDANLLGNYACALLAAGRRDEGIEVLDRVINILPTQDVSGISAECWFYTLAHMPSERYPEAIRQLKHILMAGATSPGWDLSANIDRARTEGHPYLEWLEKLASVISDGADISILDDWPEWRKAALPPDVN